MEHDELKSVIEGLLFISGDEGLEAKQLAEIMETNLQSIVLLLEEMKAEFKRTNRGIQIIEVAGTYQLATLAEHTKYFEKLAYSPSSSTLSQAALETLAIIAYRQPISRAEIEEIRGVRCEKAIHTLINKLLIKEVGRMEGIGRAILYGTTKEFLEYFALKQLTDLPPLSGEVNIEQLQLEADLFFTK